MINFDQMRNFFEQRMQNHPTADENVVHQQFDQLQQQFKALHNFQMSGEGFGDSAAARCLPVLLAALGWNGERRHVIEALPHVEMITDLSELQMVLNRLNFSAEMIDAPHPERLSECLPCLVEFEGDIGILLDITPDNKGFLYLGDTDIYTELPLHNANCNFFMLKKISGNRGSKTGRYNWMHETIVALKSSIFQIFRISTVINILVLMTTLYVTMVYDKAIGGKSQLTLFFFCLGIIGIMAGEIYLRKIRSNMIAYMGARMDALIQINTFRSIINLPLVMTETAPLSAQMARFKQFEIGKDLFISSIAAAILDLPFTIVFIGAIFVMGGVLGWFTVALVVLFAVLSLVAFPIMEATTARAGEAKSKSDVLALETAAKLNSIRENNIERIWVMRMRDRLTTYLDYRFQSQNISSLFQTIAQNLVMLTAVTTMAVGAMKVMDKTLTIGGLIGVTTLMWRVFMPIQVLFLSIQRLKQVFNTMSQINQLFRLKLEREPGHVPTFFRKFQGSIFFNAVSFKYASGTDLAIKGAMITIQPNEMVAVIGPNGAGKSTLLKLMMGLYQPVAGAVRLDGLDLRQLDVGEVRQMIAYAPQALEFYYGTVAQNIALADPTVSQEKIIHALKEAKFEVDPERFPDGLNTRLDFATRSALQDGMLQRLNLARAWVKDSPLVILDEPGTRLDQEGDQALIAKLTALKGKSTVVFVTARPSHMMLADRVICLVKGQIVAEGKPEEIVPKYMDAMSKASVAA